MGFVEIKRSLNLTLDECTRADLHSLLNATNLLYEELVRLGDAFDDPDLRAGAESCLAMLDSFTVSPHRALQEFLLDLRDMRAHLRVLATENPRSEADTKVLMAIIDVLQERVLEMDRDRFEWRPMAPSELIANLARFLDTTALVSRGNFHVTYAPEEGQDNAYEVDFQVDTSRDTICAPLVFCDVLRDLVANARKYSRPPARIEVRLEVSPEGDLDLRVTDEGIGIPAAELERVVEPGFRASNATSKRTLGGGLGLTKAYLLSRAMGGGLWIDSKEGRGTTVRLLLRPAAEGNGATALIGA